MPDYIEITDAGGTKRKVSVDELSEAIFAQRQKMQWGADGEAKDVSTSNPMPVSDAGGSLTVDGSVAIGSALPAGSNNIGQVDPRGNVAHGAADSGNPVKVGGKGHTALPTPVANNDRTNLATDKFGRVFALAAPLDQSVSGTLNRINNTAANVIAAPGASTAIVVTDILVTNAHTSVGTKVSIRDGESVKVTGFAAAGGGGFQLSNADGLFVATANAAITGICGTTGADVDIFVAGYKVPA